MHSKKLLNKLERVERTINIYNWANKEPVEEINIDIIPFDRLKEIIIPKEDDPLLYDGYMLEKKQVEEINKFLSNKIFPNLELHFYVLECAGIYNWQNEKGQ